MGSKLDWISEIADKVEDMDKKISMEDLRMVKYYWEEKEDLLSWCDWENRKGAIQEFAPEVVKAWEDYFTARRILCAVIESIPCS
mgnify:CR=1 FL=1|tara:strand:+ start:574 stop:828 length:255 start_codon:yes stop_codon:yes gene_type:complete